MTESKSLRLTQAEKSRFLGRTYGWMAVALLISAFTAFFTAANIWVETEYGMRISPLGNMLFGTGFFGFKAGGFMAFCILEILIVIFFTARIRTMSLFAAICSYLLYAVVNGFTLSSIFAVYEITSIANAFLATAVTFFVMCLYGTKTKSDLTKAGRYLVMALLGIVLASVLHLIISKISGSPLAMLDLLISVATVVVFTGLTAWDAQKIIKTAEQSVNSDDYKKASLLGALELYLDFINLLLALLRLFGRKK